MCLFQLLSVDGFRKFTGVSVACGDSIMLKIKVDGVVELLYVYYSMFFKYEQIELLLCGKTAMGRIKVNTKRR